MARGPRVVAQPFFFQTATPWVPPGSAIDYDLVFPMPSVPNGRIWVTCGIVGTLDQPAVSFLLDGANPTVVQSTAVTFPGSIQGSHRQTSFPNLAAGNRTVTIRASRSSALWFGGCALTESGADVGGGVGTASATVSAPWPTTTRMVGSVWGYGATDITMEAGYTTLLTVKSLVEGMGTVVLWTRLGTGGSLTVAPTITGASAQGLNYYPSPFSSGGRSPCAGGAGG